MSIGVYWCLYLPFAALCRAHRCVAIAPYQAAIASAPLHWRRSIRMAFPACTYMQESCACSGLARHNCRSLESVCDRRRRRECSPFHSHIRLWSSIFRMPKATSSTSRRADVFWGPSKRGYRPDGWAAVLRPHTSWRLPSLCSSRKHAAQSDAGLPESSTADVVSGGNVIVLLNPDSIAQAAARQCRTCCATKHRFGRPGAVVGAHIASAVLSPRLMARSTLRENHS